jgi:hypothetical protein
MNRFHPGLQAALHAYAQEFAVVVRRAHVINIPTVADLPAVAVRLRVVLVVRPVKAAVEVILIVPQETPVIRCTR